MYTDQGGILTGDVAESAVYNGGSGRPRSRQLGGSICEAIYKCFHPGSTSSLAMLCPSFASSFRAS